MEGRGGWMDGWDWVEYVCMYGQRHFLTGRRVVAYVSLAKLTSHMGTYDRYCVQILAGNGEQYRNVSCIFIALFEK